MAAQRAQSLADAIRGDGLLSGMARNGLHPDVCEALLAEVAAALDIVEES